MLENEQRLLRRWSTLLLGLAIITLIFSIISPLSDLLADNAPIVLIKGEETWKTTMRDLPQLEANVCLLLFMLPNFAWMYAVVQMAKLAIAYRKGDIFQKSAPRRFMKIGIGLVVMGIFNMLVLPAIACLFYYRGISPWLADMPFLTVFEPDLLVAGCFFFVLGKIMHYGVALQEADRLTV